MDTEILFVIKKAITTNPVFKIIFIVNVVATILSGDSRSCKTSLSIRFPLVLSILLSCRLSEKKAVSLADVNPVAASKKMSMRTPDAMLTSKWLINRKLTAKYKSDSKPAQNKIIRRVNRQYLRLLN